MKRPAGMAICALALAVVVALAGCGTASATRPANPNTVNMGLASFSPTAITIKKGSTITFASTVSTGTLHILAIGRSGQNETEKGAPDFGGNAAIRVDQNADWTSPPWNTAGTYHVTCTVHPGTMNLMVTVTD
jgi:plastocyanin